MSTALGCTVRMPVPYIQARSSSKRSPDTEFPDPGYYPGTFH